MHSNKMYIRHFFVAVNCIQCLIFYQCLILYSVFEISRCTTAAHPTSNTLILYIYAAICRKEKERLRELETQLSEYKKKQVILFIFISFSALFI